MSTPIDPIDYLVIGHVTCDITPQGCKLGGSAAYSALTARALGLRPGIITSCTQDLSLDALQGIPIINLETDRNTTFENISTASGRKQILSSVASSLGYQNIPESWRNTAIIHLAPVAQEVEPYIVRMITNPLLGATPQGWLRTWDDTGTVSQGDWPEASFVLERCGAAIISIEDVNRDEQLIEEFAAACPVLAVTEAGDGSRIYWNGDVRRFRTPFVLEKDSIGSGDIFAACFLTRLYTTHDPWESGRFATQLASYSVTRQGMDSVPTPEEVESSLVEVL